MDITIKIEEKKRTLYVEATVESIPQLTAYMENFLTENNVSIKVQMQMNIVVDEIFSNIAKYAFDKVVGVAKIICAYSDNKDEITLTFEDNGMEYNPLTAKSADITLPLEEREIGGLGLLVVKNMMDTVEYRYENGYNILTMTKSVK